MFRLFSGLKRAFAIASTNKECNCKSNPQGKMMTTEVQENKNSSHQEQENLTLEGKDHDRMAARKAGIADLFADHSNDEEPDLSGLDFDAAKIITDAGRGDTTWFNETYHPWRLGINRNEQI